MYVVVQHAIKDPSIAFDRGRKLMVGEGCAAEHSGPAVPAEPGRFRRHVPVGVPDGGLASGVRRRGARRLERQRLLPGRRASVRSPTRRPSFAASPAPSLV